MKVKFVVCALAAAMTVAMPVDSAQAGDRHGRDLALGLLLGAAAVGTTAAIMSAPSGPVYAAPPPVYYAPPPPVYYAPPPPVGYYAAPPPVYYAPPPPPVVYYAPPPPRYYYRGY
ncbi:hypothetical protein [Magnetospirillum molischianum]|uniref:Uncharacterized protein n=1 Tax=Magnetospirillum molischianum DSM 120 TaxID=1150626 RepID=H8FVW4_MAGML|nr:hypothetical protein [Magnetospirillum molischianum]CCG42502.1 conserved exported hypothetical protein [Magnetospirillum molischianum DSM 120]